VWVFLAASVVAQLVVIQIAVLLGVGHLLYGIGLGPSPLVVLLVGSLCFLAGGFLIAALSRREQAAVVMTNLVWLPQLFVAGVFYPLAGAPLWLQKLSIVMPLTDFSASLRGLMAESQTLAQVTRIFWWSWESGWRCSWWPFGPFALRHQPADGQRSVVTA